MQYLDHGAFGGLPDSVSKSQATIHNLIESDPHDFFERKYVDALLHSKKVLASFLGVDVDGLVLVGGATHALNVVIQSQKFSTGDEILTTNFAYSSIKLLLDSVASRDGANVVVAQIPFPVASCQEVTDSLLAHVTDRTRIAVIDHVPSRTGLVLPIKEIVSGLKARGVETVVDGAHAPGMFPLDIPSTDAPYYVGNCHKWMCAPRGIGFLYMREDRRDVTKPLVIARSPHAANAHKCSALQNQFDWLGTFDPSAFLTIPKAIEFLQTALPGGHGAMFERNHRLALAARDVFCRRLNLPLPTPDHMIGTMVSIPLPDSPEPECKGMTSIQKFLWEQHWTEIPIYPWPAHPKRMLRISVQLYNSLDQYKKLAENVAAYLQLEKQGVEIFLRSDHAFPTLEGCNEDADKMQNGYCDPLVKIDTCTSGVSQRLPLPRKAADDIRWPSFDVLSRLSMDRILYSGGFLKEPPSLLFPTAETEYGQYFPSTDWEEFGNLETEKARLTYTLARYPCRGIPSASLPLIDNLLSNHCVLEGWSSHLCELLKDQGVAFLTQSLHDVRDWKDSNTLPTYETNTQSATLSSSLWKRALESISRNLQNPEKSIQESIIAFIQIHAFLKDPIDGLRRCFNLQLDIFVDLLAELQKQTAKDPLIDSAQESETVLAQLAQESSFLAIPKIRKVAYLHFSGHQQLPYAYVTVRKLHRTELCTPSRVLEIARELLANTAEQGSCEVAPITVTYQPAVQALERRLKVIVDGNNRFMAILLLQFLSYRKLAGDDAEIQLFFRKHEYNEQWHSELKEVLKALTQQKALSNLLQEHVNPLRYFKSVVRIPALVVQEAEFHTILTTSKTEGGRNILLQPAQQTICAISSSVAINPKGQSHGRPRGYCPLPLR